MKKTPTTRPDKPYAGFPMFAHPCGYWCKKIRKRLVYFGKWADDPDGTAALERFNREWPFLQKGLTPPATDVNDGCTVKQMCDEFLTSKEKRVESGELSPRTFQDYYETCVALTAEFGRDRLVVDLGPDDFREYRAKLATKRGVVGLGNEINRCRVVFKYAIENELIDKPVRVGQEFERPSAKMRRRARNEAGERMFEREEIIRILADLKDEDNLQLRAMVLLGVNCGFGNTDIASLPQSAVDFDTGWIDFPRPKTEIHRRIPLWKETVDALRRAIKERPTPKHADGRGLCFITKYGNRWVRPKSRGVVRKFDGEAQDAFDRRVERQKRGIEYQLDSIGQEFGKTLDRLRINGRRGLGFYTLRHVFQTIGGECKDQVAVSAIMGHVDTTMAGQYRERISDERLQAVVGTVHGWLWPKTSGGKKGGAR